MTTGSAEQSDLEVALPLPIHDVHVVKLVAIGIHDADPEVLSIPGELGITVGNSNLMALCSRQVSDEHHATAPGVPSVDGQRLDSLGPGGQAQRGQSGVEACGVESVGALDDFLARASMDGVYRVAGQLGAIPSNAGHPYLKSSAGARSGTGANPPDGVAVSLITAAEWVQLPWTSVPPATRTSPATGAARCTRGPSAAPPSTRPRTPTPLKESRRKTRPQKTGGAFRCSNAHHNMTHAPALHALILAGLPTTHVTRALLDQLPQRGALQVLARACASAAPRCPTHCRDGAAGSANPLASSNSRSGTTR